MAESSHARAARTVLSHGEPAFPEFERKIEALARTLVSGTSAEAVLISCSVGGFETVAREPGADSRWHAMTLKALAALDAAALNETPPRDSLEPARVVLTPQQIAAISAEARSLDTRAQVLAATEFDRDMSGRVVLIAPIDRFRPELEASLQLAIDAAISICWLHLERKTSAHWREEAANASAKLGDESKALDEIRRIDRIADDASRALLDAPAESRLDRLGEVAAASTSFEDWIVAQKRGDQFVILAAARRKTGESVRRAILAEASMTRHVVSRDTPDLSLFPCRCVAVAIVDLVLALSPVAESGAPESILEALATRLAPIVRLWNLEAESIERRALLQRMALRMFAAVDEERARIARDLHDDQAQLLAAAEIALEGGREQARTILKQVEIELRRRTRELRPASLGSASLGEQIEREITRLTDAGIAGRFVPGRDVDRMARPVQQLCYQLTREALSNVIRHAHAHSAEVRIDLSAGIARVSVADDGRGIHAASTAKGGGLAGLRERVELMGGRLRIESTTQGTIVTAEIPEPSTE